MDIAEHQLVTLTDTVIICGVRKRERQDPCVDKIRSVDTGEALRDHGADAEIKRDQRRVLTG